MVTNEWALIIYTLLIQAAIGAYIMSFVIKYRLTSRIGEEQALKLVIPVQYAAGVSGIAGMVVSLFHLGTPLKAPNSILNPVSSWLSREILFTGAFLILLIVTVLLVNRTRKMSSALVVVTSLVGLADIYCMSNIYSSSLIPAWQGLYTFVVFYSACFILGGLAAIGTLVFSMGKQKTDASYDLYTSIFAPIGFVILAAIAIQVIILPNYLVNLAAAGGAAQASAQMLSEQYGMIIVVRWLLTLCGGLFLILAAWKQLQGSRSIAVRQTKNEAAATAERVASGTVPASLIYLTFAVIAAGEVIGRYLFYASGVQITLGMF